LSGTLRLRLPLLALLVFVSHSKASAQRVQGVDISYWNTGNNQSYSDPNSGLTQANWNTAFSTGNIKFAFIRASRGGTTGFDQPSGTPGGGSQSTFSERYDDPRFMQNITRASAAGMLTGAYHFTRPDITTNTGADEADHFMQIAGAWMRPGYLLPIHDFEAGDGFRTDDQLAQFCIDFSNRIYEVMGIRPGIYLNGNYSANILQTASAGLRTQIVADYPLLWDARPDSNTDWQNRNPKDTYSGFYGPWDDAGETHPWDVWQYSTTSSIPGINAVESGVDADMAHGDIEYMRDFLIPAVWWNDSSGDWSTLTNWNSGQTPVAPATGRGQAPLFTGGSLPTARLPGAAGSGPTSGQYDTVVLDRPSSNITVSLASGAYNIRKLYMRETLNITGGSLTINYNPEYVADNVTYPNSRRSGPISAQFSGAVTMSGGSLSVHTLQVDANKTFTMSGGTLTIDTMNLMPLSGTPAKLIVSGDVTINPLNGAAAVIQKGSGSGNTAVLDLGGGMRTLTVGNGAAATDLTISIPVINGGLTKAGAGTLALTAANSYTGKTEVQAGTLSLSVATLANAADVLISNGAALKLGFAGSDVIHALFLNGVSQPAGAWGAVGSGAQFISPLITGTGMLQVAAFVGTPLGGDFNSDGLVNGADLAVWQANIGLTTGATHSQGDANDDGIVDGADYLVWQTQLGMMPTAVAAAAAVPEPTTMVMIAACGLIMLAGCRSVARG
jgi:autotransporter-associated beta strand protein